jgi:hypothetical protein
LSAIANLGTETRRSRYATQKLHQAGLEGRGDHLLPCRVGRHACFGRVGQEQPGSTKAPAIWLGASTQPGTAARISIRWLYELPELVRSEGRQLVVGPDAAVGRAEAATSADYQIGRKQLVRGRKVLAES